MWLLFSGSVAGHQGYLKPIFDSLISQDGVAMQLPGRIAATRLMPTFLSFFEYLKTDGKRQPDERSHRQLADSGKSFPLSHQALKSSTRR